MARKQRLGNLQIRTRILGWTLLFSMAPLLAMYFVFSSMLHATQTLIVKDAGDYAQRKTQLLDAAVREDLDESLRTGIETLRLTWQRLYDFNNGDLDDTVRIFGELLRQSPTVVFLYDPEGRLLVSSTTEQGPEAPPDPERADDQLGRAYRTALVRLDPNGYILVLATPRQKSVAWHSASQRFGMDFTGSVKAKVSSVLSQVRLLALSFLVAMCFIALILSRWLTKNLTSPLVTLAEAIESFDGETAVHITAERHDEIGLLTERFADMTRKLVETRQQLGAKQDALERADQELMQLNLNLEQRITDRTAELSLALERLRELDMNKDDFLSLVSHELKTPLTSISASAEALMVEDLPLSAEGRRRFLHIIRTEASRLARLINDLLDLTGLESGRLQFHFRHTDLGKLVRNTVDNLRLTIEKKGLEIEIEISDDPRLGNTLLDPDRVVQVVTNLLSNAVKYTERGTISLSLNVTDSDTEPLIHMVVADTGIGIRPEDRHKVFDRFQQIERIDTHHEGFGLGMPISKMLVEGMGGDIRYASKAEHGTAFTVTLPFDAQAATIGQR